ncbi:MAG TPA: cell division protein FtsL [Steroidobacteraceae bacterium]|nr:cell division protein FtsL [Steroidobacteraceae bacterium]
MSARRILILVLPILWFAVLASATAVVYERYEARLLFARLEQLNTQRDALDSELSRLELEKGTWSSNALVEKMAGAKLHMVMPQPAEVRIVRP